MYPDGLEIQGPPAIWPTELALSVSGRPSRASSPHAMASHRQPDLRKPSRLANCLTTAEGYEQCYHAFAH